MTLAQISDRLAAAIGALNEAEDRSCVARVADELLALRLEIERDAIRAWRMVEA